MHIYEAYYGDHLKLAVRDNNNIILDIKTDRKTVLRISFRVDSNCAILSLLAVRTHAQAL